MVTGLPFRYRFHYRYQLVHFQRHHPVVPLAAVIVSFVASIIEPPFTVTVALSQLVGFSYHRFGIRYSNFLQRIFRHYYSSCGWIDSWYFHHIAVAGVVIVNVTRPIVTDFRLSFHYRYQASTFPASSSPVVPLATVIVSFSINNRSRHIHRYRCGIAISRV
jgi:hypothetical protein